MQMGTIAGGSVLFSAVHIQSARNIHTWELLKPLKPHFSTKKFGILDWILIKINIQITEGEYLII